MTERKPLRVVFFGTPDIAASILQSLLDDVRFEVVAVVAQPDKTGGRGHQTIEPATKKLAKKHHIPCFQPEKLLRNESLLQDLEKTSAQYFVVSAYGRIISKKILSIPTKGCFNIHYSVLPEYRGASPIQGPLLDGKKETGTTLQKMVYEMDAGDIVDVLPVDIDPFETTTTLYKKFMNVSGAFTCDALVRYDEGHIHPVPQDPDVATFCGKIEKNDGWVNPTLPIKKSFQNWQGYTSWPGYFFFLGKKRLLIELCSWVEEKSSEKVGTLLVQERADYPVPMDYVRPKKVLSLMHRDGVLVLLQVKMEGKSSMGIEAFLQGNAGHIQDPKYKSDH